MPKPVAVIVGRPNVGKSTFFNRIVGRQAAIVEDIPGVTRDRNYMNAEWEDKPFVIVDTGGFYPQHDDNIFIQIKEQALFAIDEADVIIHLFDGKEGLTPNEADLVKLLRASGKPVLWAVNKIDAESRMDKLTDFYSLGLDEIHPVSAATGLGFDDLMDRLAALMPESIPETLQYPKLAIVGRPNTGKSTLVNSLLGQKRMLVSPVAGTTRDPVDSVATYYGKKYLFIDTAGIRRKNRRGYSIERFAMVRTLKSIERADMAVIIIDASEGVVSDDQKIAGMVRDYGRSALFVLNKWDLVRGEPDDAYRRLTAEIAAKFWFFPQAPVLTTSGLDRTRITKIFPLANKIMSERSKRVRTSVLNRIVSEFALPSASGRKVKIYYMTQYGTSPPEFAIFTNKPSAIKDSHVRHIEAKLREAYGFMGTPIRIRIKERA
jgi:GTP-binding protein